MDYEAAYWRFIESRKMRPKLEGEYMEQHHIKAVCQGGTDDPENLIWLTGREHAFAHLLMAFAFGGKLWLAATAMDLIVGKRKGMNTRLVGIARREAVKAMSGDNSPVADKRLYSVKNLLTGEVKTGTRAYMNSVWGIPPVRMYMLITGRVKRYENYCMEGTYIDEYLILEKPQKFIKLETGEIITASRLEMRDNFNLPMEGSLSLLIGKCHNWMGYTLAEPVIEPKPLEVHAFRHLKSGEVIITDRFELQDKHGLRLKDSVRLVKGLVQTTYGFEYVGPVVDGEVKPVMKPVKPPPSDSRVKNKVVNWRKEGDDIVYQLSRTELRDRFGVPIWASKDVLSGKCKSYKGWHVEGTDLKDKSHDNRLHKIKNINTGEVFKVTRKFIMTELGLSRGQATNLIQGTAYNNGGYCLADAAMPEDNSWRDKTVYIYQVVKTGEIIKRTRKQMVDEFGMTSANLTNIAKGYIKTSRGFRFIGKEEAPCETSKVQQEETVKQHPTSESSPEQLQAA